MNSYVILNHAKMFYRNALGIPLLIILLLAMIVLPLPPFALDVLFSFNISLSLVVLMVVIYAKRPLDFSVFPTVLLMTTLMRLGLNIASTRVVLLNGHTGSASAGKVIESFGEVVIGGNYAVGFIVFIILIIINFVVITKGAGRVSEVSARFTLDAMPGKQMGIDADLNAGLINQEEAKIRRQQVTTEADFYGSMDGASKFVRGDAIAGIMILVINLLGGIAIGVMQHSLSLAESLKLYGLLTIGDGLVAQIPAILLSTAAAILVTRVTDNQDVGDEFKEQLFTSPRVLAVAGSIITFIGIIPGMPHIAFVGLGSILLAGSYFINKSAINNQQKLEQEQQKEMEAKPEQEELSYQDIRPVDAIGLEIGYRLISLVDAEQSGELMIRIKGIRRKLSQEYGFLIPTVHIRDNLELAPDTYRISINGVEVGDDQVFANKELAINPGQVFGSLDGIDVKDPAFQLDAKWIDSEVKEQAQNLGFTVVDASTVLATHLSECLQKNLFKLLSYEDIENLLNNLSQTSAKLVEDAKEVSLSTFLKVCQSLLEDRIPIRDFKTICEVLVNFKGKEANLQIIISAVRVALSKFIIQQINGGSEELNVVSLDPNLEQILQQGVKNGGESLIIEPGLAEQMKTSLISLAERLETDNKPPVLMVSGFLRHHIARMFRYAIPSLSVIAYEEIPDDKVITVIGTVGNQSALLESSESL